MPLAPPPTCVPTATQRAEFSRGASLPYSPPFGASMGYSLETRLECLTSKTVRYAKEPGMILRLPIPLDRATNRQAVQDHETKRARVEGQGGTQGGTQGNQAASQAAGEPVVPVVPLSACLEAWAADETVSDFKSPALLGGAAGPARQSTKFKSFPPVLLVCASRYTVTRRGSPRSSR